MSRFSSTMSSIKRISSVFLGAFSFHIELLQFIEDSGDLSNLSPSLNLDDQGNAGESNISDYGPNDYNDDYNTPSEWRVYDDESTTMNTPFGDEDDNRFPFPMENTSFEGPVPNPLGNYPAQQKSESGSRGADAWFWFYLCVAIIASIGLIGFGAFIVYDLSKQHQRKSEEREQYIAQKIRELDHVGMSPSAKTGPKESPPSSPKTSQKGKESTTEKKTNASESKTTVRSPLNESKAWNKNPQKASKPVPKESKPKASNRHEPSKKTLSSV